MGFTDLRSKHCAATGLNVREKMENRLREMVEKKSMRKSSLGIYEEALLYGEQSF